MVCLESVVPKAWGKVLVAGMLPAALPLQVQRPGHIAEVTYDRAYQAAYLYVGRVPNPVEDVQMANGLGCWRYHLQH